VDIHDPWVGSAEAKTHFDVNLVESLKENHYDAVIVAVAHDQFRDMGIENIRKLTREQGIIYDIKYLFPSDSVDGRL